MTQGERGSKKIRGYGWNVAWGSVLGVALLSGANFWPEEPNEAAGTFAAPDAMHHHADEADRTKALALLARSFKEMAKVEDYQMELHKKERLNGKLGAEQIIDMVVRQHPFKIRMSWKEPKSLSGQVGIFCQETNPKRMKGKSAGFLGNLGFISMGLDDPLSRATSRHGIDEAGFQNLFNRLKKSWGLWGDEDDTKVRVTQGELDRKTCITVDVLQSPSTNTTNEFARTIVIFAADTGFPIRLELYAWAEDGKSVGDLLESYKYNKLEINSGLTEDFRKN